MAKATPDKVPVRRPLIGFDVKALLDLNSADDYRRFLRIKGLPQRRFVGSVAEYPDEYARIVEGKAARTKKAEAYTPIAGLFDYQRDIAALAIKKRKFAVFAECGLGKSLIDFEYVRHVLASTKGKVMLVCPLMVTYQMRDEVRRFYGDTLPCEIVRADALPAWTESKDGERFGITNFEAITDRVNQGNLSCIVISESSMMKNHYGKWATRLIELGKGLDWKLCETGTPAPNDRIEYANHAVFLDQYPTVNAFLARYFVNRGMTGERWELKPHAVAPFYRDLSHWCIFLSDPAVYGWKDNTSGIPPIHVHYHDVALTDEQTELAQAEGKSLFVGASGGFVNRQRMAQISKGRTKGGRIETLKPEFIRSLVESFGGESSVVWCRFNEEQDALAAILPGAASISGDTPEDVRREIIRKFQLGEIKTLISKPKIMGFGLNLQICTRMVFSSLQDSYEEYHQSVKRANRYGSTQPLNVHIPFTAIELPMIENVMRKSRAVQSDTDTQQLLFKENRFAS